MLDAAGVERTAIWGASDLGLSALFAATYPERVTSLILSSVAPQGGATLSPEIHAQLLDAIENHWGDGTLLEMYAPEPGRERELRSVVGTDAALVGQPRDGAAADRHGRADRSAGDPADDPGADARDPPDRRPLHPGRGRPRGRLADPRRAVHRVPRRGHLRVGAEPGHRRRRGVLDRPARSVGDRSRARHRHVHRHRRLDRARLARSATVAGARCSTTTTHSFATSSSAGAGRRSRRSATDSWRRSTARRGRSSARRASSMRARRSGWRSGPACTPASASSSATTSRGSRSTSARG